MALSTEQRRNAATIIQVGRRSGMTKKDAVAAIATALVESELKNVAYGDRDSLGLFQQRPSQGWGTPQQVQNPTYAAGKFYEAMKKIPGYAGIPVGTLSQAIQRSAYPMKYAQREAEAREIVNQLWDGADNAGDTDTVSDIPATDDTGFLSQVKSVSDAFKKLTDPEFWKRTGILILGAALVGIALWSVMRASPTYQKGQRAVMGMATRGVSEAVT